VPDYAAALKPDALSFTQPGVLGVCFLSAYLALADQTGPGDTIHMLAVSSLHFLERIEFESLRL
jgi:hypothetical protein